MRCFAWEAGPRAKPARKPATQSTTQPAAKPKPPAKDSFKSGERVEVKKFRSWEPATIKNRDGDLYLVILDGWETQFHWQWAHVSGVRKPGSDKEGPDSADTVGVGIQGVDKAKTEARRTFKGIEQRLALETTFREKEKAEEAKRQAEWDAKFAQARGNAAARPGGPAGAGGPAAAGAAAGREGGTAQGRPLETRRLVQGAEGDGPGRRAHRHRADPEPAPARPLTARSIPLTILDAVTRKGPGGETLGFENYFGPFFASPAAGRAAVGYQRHYIQQIYTPTAVEWIDLVAGKSIAVTHFDYRYHPYDISPDGKRVVLGPGPMNALPGAAPIQIWELGDDGQAKPVVFFKPFAAHAPWTAVKAVRFVDADHVIVIGAFTEIGLFKLSEARAVWWTPISIFSELVLSPNRKQVALGTESSNDLTLLETMTGKTLARYGGKGQAWGKANFSPDGARLAVGALNRLFVYDVATGKLVHDAAVPSPSSASEVLFPPAGAGHVLLADYHTSYLFDPAKQFVPWVYKLGGPRRPAPACWPANSATSTSATAPTSTGPRRSSFPPRSCPTAAPSMRWRTSTWPA